MRRLFLSISLGILMALIVASIIASQVLRYSFDQHMRERIESRHRGQVEIIKERLDSVPESELESETAKLHESTLTTFKLVLFDSTLIPTKISEDLKDRPRSYLQGSCISYNSPSQRVLRALA